MFSATDSGIISRNQSPSSSHCDYRDCESGAKTTPYLPLPTSRDQLTALIIPV